MSVDFTKAELGQEVSDLIYGNGCIHFVDESSVYSVGVRFDDGTISRFTKEGSLYTYGVPSLCVGHDTAKLDQGELPFKPKPLKFDGTPVWAYVSDTDYEETTGLSKRLVVAAHNGEFLAMSSYKNNTQTTSTSIWWRAWEIEDE